MSIEQGIDGFRVRYILIFVCSLLLMEAYLRVTQLSMVVGLGIMIALIHGAAIGLYFLITAIYKAAKGYWKQLLSLIIAPLLAFSIFIFQVWIGLTPDYLQFIIMKPWYFAVVSQSGEGESTFHAWFWEATRGGLITPTYTVLIYDGTDQIVRSPDKRTTDWVDRVKIFALKDGLELWDIADPTSYSTRPRKIIVDKLADHFYFVTQTSN